MKQTLILTALLASLAASQAQENLPREEALKVAFIVSADLKQLLSTPIPTDPDVKRPVAVRAGDRGGLVLPECKLTAGVLAKAGKDVVPLGQLWLRHAVPQSEGQPVSQAKLLTVTVGSGDKASAACLCALGLRKDADGKLELLVYGKDKEPIIKAPIKEISDPQQENPLEISAEPQGESALVTLKIVGKYEASFAVVPD